MKYLVSYSGGIGSFWAAKKLVEEYGKDNVVAIFTDTNWEDPDLYKFIDQTINHLGIDLIYLKAPYTPKELSKLENVMYNSRIASCTKILKMRLYKSFINCKPYVVFRKKFDIEQLTITGFEYYGKINPNEFKLVLGIDWTEAHRTKTINENWEKYNYTVEYPLVKDLTYDKSIAFDYLKEHNIITPSLYPLGFSHNNCGGRCFKAGQGHFRLLLEKLPDRFTEMEEFEASGNGHTILTKTKNKIKRSYPLSELKSDYYQNNEIDEFDIGGCGCFVDEDFDE